MAEETEGRHLDLMRLGRGVARALTDRSRGRYLVAERDGEVVGALFVTLEWSDWRNGWFWWIQSVYTSPAERRTGVYRALHEQVLAEARAAGDVCGVRLYVERENESAQTTYARLGMRRTGYLLYEIDFLAE